MNKTLKVLVVDDEPLIRRAFLLVGKSRRHEMKEAKDGKEALAIWPLFDPDLVFLDVLLPDGNGFQILESLPKSLRFKCVVMSAHDNLEERRFKGFHLFVRKPFEDIFKVFSRGEQLIFEDISPIEKKINTISQA